MPLFWYTKSKEAKGKISATSEEWQVIEKLWIKNHPILHIINEIWDFFYYSINRVYNNLIFFFKHEISGFVHRGLYGWAKHDTWSFYSYHAKVCRDSIKHLKNNIHGYPTLMFEDNMETDKNGNPTKKSDEKCSKKWEEILDNIIYAFDMHVKESEGEIEFYYEGYTNTPHAQELYKKHNLKGLTKEEQEKVELGMQYFVKYYRCLWD